MHQYEGFGKTLSSIALESMYMLYIIYIFLYVHMHCMYMIYLQNV